MSLPFAVSIGDSLQQGLDGFFGFLPNLLGFLVILLIGFIVARVVKGIIAKALEKLGVDRTLRSGQTGQWVEKVSPGASPSRLIGAVAFWFIFLFAISAAIAALQIPALTAFVADVQRFLPNIIVAVLIFVAAGAISGAVGGLVAKTMGDTPTGKIVGTVVPVLVMGIAFFMILNQLQIAPQIVTVTYTALIGAIALGLALAFGLGGRELAGEMLRDAYDKGREQKDQAESDLRRGRERGERMADRAQSGRLPNGAGDGAGTASVGGSGTGTAGATRPQG
jgi:hypothetical protein